MILLNNSLTKVLHMKNMKLNTQLYFRKIALMLCGAYVGSLGSSVYAADVLQVLDKQGGPAFVVDSSNMPASLLESDLFISREAETVSIFSAPQVEMGEADDQVLDAASAQLRPDVDVPAVSADEFSGEAVPIFPENLDQLTENSEALVERAAEQVVENVPAPIEAAPSANNEATITPLPQDDSPVLVQEVDAPPPPQENFASPQVNTKTGGVPPVPQIEEVPFNDGLFFDSEAPSAIPSTQLGQKGAVRRVNPSVEPASKLDIVVKNRSQGSRQARLVSADRALKLGRYDSALEIYNRLYDKNPRDLNVLMGRAIALQNLQRDEAAMQAYQDILSESPGHIKASVNMYGLVARRFPSVALRNLLQLHEAHPQNIGVLAQMSVIEAHLGRYDNAMRYIGMASSYQPKNANHIYNMAVISDRAGDKDKAFKYYEQALEIDAVYGGSRTVPREAIFTRLAQLR